MVCCRCSITQKKIWVFGCGTFVLALALVLGLLWPTLSLSLLYSQLVLKEGSLNYQNWISTPIPMYLEIYLFDWKNPDDITKPDVKPIFEERGPYTFLEHHRRVDVDWHKNSTVTFYQIREWHFEPTKSNGSLDDEIQFADVITATAAYTTRHNGTLVKMFANYMINHKGGALYRKKTVRELLFDGYDDQLLDFLKKLNTSSIKIPFDKFGWFAERNSSKTYDGLFNMHTGEDDIFKLGRMDLWNKRNRTDFYPDSCGIVNGTTGELWPPNINMTKPVSVFVTDICRSVTIQFNETVEKYGIEGGKWIGDDKVFDNGLKYPDMKCYCIPELSQDKKTEECSAKESGLLDVSECRYGAPVFVSYPHFYLADEKYVNDVVGMFPNKEKHEFTISLEPTTGIPLDVNARLQINMLLQPMDKIDIYKHIPKKIMFPMFWFRQTVELDEDLASQAKMALLLPKVGLWTSYVLASAGAIVIIVGIILTLTKTWSRRHYEDEELLSD